MRSVEIYLSHTYSFLASKEVLVALSVYLELFLEIFPKCPSLRNVGGLRNRVSLEISESVLTEWLEGLTALFLLLWGVSMKDF